MSNGTSAYATIIGRMGKDIEIFTTRDGKKIGTITIATTSGYGDRKVDSWHTVKIFDERKVDLLSQYAGKGAKILVHGEMVTRIWEKDGRKNYSPEIIVSFSGYIDLLDSKAESEARRGSSSSRDDGRGANREDRRNPADEQRRAPPSNPFDDLDDDVPF